MLALDAAPIASTSTLPPYSPSPPSPPSYDSHDLDIDEHLPAYDSHRTLEPWLLLRHDASDLSLFLPPFAPGAPAFDKGPGFHPAPGCPWKDEYAEHVRHALEHGLDLDPCKHDVQTDFMYEAVADWIKVYIRERIPPELRNAARSLACRSQPLPLNPLFLDALHGAAPVAPPTSPSPHTHWMLDSLTLANRALHTLWRMPLPQEDLDALVEALFVLQCRERFRRAARRRAAEREGSVVHKLLASAGWTGAEGKWKKGGKASR